MNGDVVLEAKNIVKELGQGAGMVRALKGVSLTLRAGELTLLMGPSGSGKTTLLSILGCILAPTSGTVELAGERIDGLGTGGAGRRAPPPHRLHLPVLQSVPDADRAGERAPRARRARVPAPRRP